MKEIRQAIKEDKYQEFQKKFLEKYRGE